MPFCDSGDYDRKPEFLVNTQWIAPDDRDLDVIRFYEPDFPKFKEGQSTARGAVHLGARVKIRQQQHEIEVAACTPRAMQQQQQQHSQEGEVKGETEAEGEAEGGCAQRGRASRAISMQQ